MGVCVCARARVCVHMMYLCVCTSGDPSLDLLQVPADSGSSDVTSDVDDDVIDDDDDDVAF